jgi:hypothetical protein
MAKIQQSVTINQPVEQAFAFILSAAKHVVETGA